MYQDKKALDAQGKGLLSPQLHSYTPLPDTSDDYVPSTIYVNTPEMIDRKGNPIAPHQQYKTPNRAAARARAEQQARDAAAQKKGGKIICCRWYQLGLMDAETFDADQAYGKWLIENERDAMVGYLEYAPYVVRLMHNTTWQSKLFIKFLAPTVNPWSREMSYRMGVHPTGSKYGAFIMWAAVKLFYVLCQYRSLKLRIKKFSNKQVEAV
jgi:hypothetical protein